MSKWKIAVVGTVNKDTIYVPGKAPTASYGGVLYTVLPMAELAGDRADISLISNIGGDVWDTVSGFLSGCDSLNLDGVRVVDCKNNHVLLNYDSDGVKEEKCLGMVPPIPFERLEPFLRFDAICFNFISGFELSLDTLRRVRESSSSTIFIDFHSLSLGITEDGKRFLRRPKRWKDWVRCADILQMNETEAGLLAGKCLTSDQDYFSFGSEVVSLGPSALAITLGEEGSLAICRGERGQSPLQRFPPSHREEPEDPTGCGDVFLAALTLSYLSFGDIRKASVFANAAAGANSLLRGIEGISNLRNVIRDMGYDMV